MAKPKKCLNYFDVLLYDSDVSLLESDEWLNDQIISFYFEYLSHHEEYNSGDTCFVPGATAYLLLNAGEEDSMETAKAMQQHTKLGLGQLDKYKLVLLAVNDNPDVTAACGGSHWSLLVLDLCSSEARHYDTAGGTRNTPVACQLLQRLMPALRLKPGTVLLAARAPRQENGFDCGIYILAMADLVCRGRARGLDWQQVDDELCRALPPSAASQWRTKLLNLVRTLAERRTGGGA